MNYLNVIANAFTSFNIFLILITLLTLSFLRVELLKHRPIDGTFRQNKIIDLISNVWKYTTYGLIILICLLIGLKFYVDADNVAKEEHRKNIQAHKKALIVEQAKPKLNQDVFYYCLDASKSDKGISPEAIKACTDAASLDVITTEKPIQYRYTSSIL